MLRNRSPLSIDIGGFLMGLQGMKEFGTRTGIAQQGIDLEKRKLDLLEEERTRALREAEKSKGLEAFTQLAQPEFTRRLEGVQAGAIPTADLFATENLDFLGPEARKVLMQQNFDTLKTVIGGEPTVNAGNTTFRVGSGGARAYTGAVPARGSMGDSGLDISALLSGTSGTPTVAPNLPPGVMPIPPQINWIANRDIGGYPKPSRLGDVVGRINEADLAAKDPNYAAKLIDTLRVANQPIGQSDNKMFEGNVITDAPPKNAPVDFFPPSKLSFMSPGSDLQNLINLLIRSIYGTGGIMGPKFGP